MKTRYPVKSVFARLVNTRAFTLKSAVRHCLQQCTRFAAAACVATVCSSGSVSAQNYTWKNVQIVGGGFVPGIIFNESEPGLVYARTDIGGAYRQDPVSKHWIPITDWISWDDWNLTGIISLATDPVNPNNVYLAAGTYTIDWANQNGAILKSTDRGATWTTTFLPFKLGGNMPGRGAGERLAIDPNRNSILYLGAPSGHGLWRSTDSGATWSKVDSFPTGGTYVQDPANVYTADIQGINWVTFDKDTGTAGNTTQTIYVGVAEKVGPSIYRSTDGGATWSAVPGQPIGFVPHKGKLDTVNNILYIATSDTGGPYDGSAGDVWKLDTVSGTWTRISPMPSDDSNGDNYFGYSGLSIDRQNPSTIMVTAYSSWWPDTIIWRSTNGGSSWSKIWDWAGYPNRTFRYIHDISKAPWLSWGNDAVAPEIDPKLGWMTESLEIDPFNRNRMMYGTGATLYGTDNLLQWDAGGQITISVMCEGLEETAIQGLVSPPTGPQLVSIMFDVNGFKHDNVDVVPSHFHTNPSWGGSDIDYAELVPTKIVRVGSGVPGNGPDTSRSCAISTDSGETWTPHSAQEPNGISSGGGKGKIAISANGNTLVWSLEGPTSTYYSSGGNWSACSGLPGQVAIASDRVNSAKFYAFKQSTFYRSTNSGVSFTAVATSGMPWNGYVKAVPGFEGHVWVGGDIGLWRSTDSGLTFTKLTSIEAADNIGFGKAASGRTYPTIYTSGKVGGVRGIYASVDEGVTWVRINDNQHQWGWTGKDITGDPRIFGRVYLSSNGRGILYGDGNPDVSTPPPTIPAAPSGLTATAASSSQINLNWTDNSSNESGFQIDRATDAGFTANLNTTSVGANVTTHQATGLAASTTYYFRVRAFNAAGNSANSGTASATTTTPPAESVLQQNLTGGGAKVDVKGGAVVSQSFNHPGSGTYQATKLTIHVSRKSALPSANLVVSLGTSHGGGTIAGSTVNIAPATVTNTSGGATWQTLDVVFASPVTLNKGTTYHINISSATAAGKPYHLDLSPSNSYSGGTFTGGGGDGRDMWFQVWGQ